MVQMMLSKLLLCTTITLLLKGGDPSNLRQTYRSVLGKSYMVRSDQTFDASVAEGFNYQNPQLPLTEISTVAQKCPLVPLADSASSDVSLNPLSYDNDRISYNVMLRSLLSRGQLALVQEQLMKLKDRNVTLNVDTVHILIGDAFDRRDTMSVENLYREYFKSKVLLPSSRTLNILMEGYRTLKDEGKVSYYQQCYKYYDLRMDAYSYSTVVRAARTASAVKYTLSTAESEHLLSYPLIRCAIESLGKLGDPMGAVAVAGKYLCSTSLDLGLLPGSPDEAQRDCNNVPSIFDSSSSGDSLLIALLENPDFYLVPSNGYPSDSAYKAQNKVQSNGNAFVYNNDSQVMDSGYSRSELGNAFDSSRDSILPVGSKSEFESAGDLSSLEMRVQGLRCGDAAMDLVLSAILVETDTSVTSLFEGVRAVDSVGGSIISIAPAPASSKTENTANTGVLVCGSKGWCKLFTYLQRSVRETLDDQDRSREHNGNSKMKNRYDASKLRLRKLRETRDRLWSKLSAEILATEGRKRSEMVAEKDELVVKSIDEVKVPKFTVSTESVAVPDSFLSIEDMSSFSFSPSPANIGPVRIKQANMELNGRLCDSLLRCYVDDAEKAKKMWKNSILPLSKRMASSSSSNTTRSFDEICEKSLEALMFVSGYNSRADLGFEIALTVRNRKWGTIERTKLAKSYVQGKMQSKGYKSQWLKSNILNDGLERSIESELGVQLLDFYHTSNPPGKTKKAEWPVQRIRIQFNENPTN